MDRLKAWLDWAPAYAEPKLLSQAEMRRLLQEHETPINRLGPPASLLQFIVDVRTRQDPIRFRDLLRSCRDVAGPDAAIGFLSASRLGVLVPARHRPYLQAFVQELAEHYGIEAQVELLTEGKSGLDTKRTGILYARRWSRRGVWAGEFERGWKRTVRQSTRRYVEIGFATVGLMISAPLMVLLSLTIKISSPGPILSVHRRVGRSGRPCRIYRFRASSPRLSHGASAERVPPPSVTAVGGFLQETRLDRLPQLWNLLRGDLSF